MKPTFMIIPNILIVFILLLATAFFVIAEFSFVRVRSSRIEQLILEGNTNAIKVQKIISQLNGYLSACQLGITITALGLGWLGESTVEKILYPLLDNFSFNPAFSHTISFIVAFSIITFLHVVLGELAPKNIAIQKSEKISLLLARPMIWFYHLMYPFIWLLNGAAIQFVRLFGIKPSSELEDVHSEEELLILLSASFQRGEINQSEYRYVNKIFDFDEISAREIMVPRMDMKVLDINNTFEENLNTIKKEQYTRFPLIDSNKDEIIGMINTKEVFLRILDGKQEIDFSEIMRPVLFVFDKTPIKTLMTKMQKESSPFAILIDEYGGTSGLVTLENILEEIVGDIRDEFDGDERPEIEKITHKEIIVDGMVLISEVNSLLGVKFEKEGIDTIGGFIASINPDLKKNGTLTHQNATLNILECKKNRYLKIQIRVN